MGAVKYIYRFRCCGGMAGRHRWRPFRKCLWVWLHLKLVDYYWPPRSGWLMADIKNEMKGERRRRHSPIARWLDRAGGGR
jgi:hypothetical protein